MVRIEKEGAVPSDRKWVDELVRSVRLSPKNVADIIRMLKLDEFCNELSDELLLKLMEAVQRPDEQAVLAMTSDPRLSLVLSECMQSEKGRAKILEAVDLAQYCRQFPDGGGEWMN